MIGRAIQAKNVNQNAKKWKRPPKSSKIKCLFLDYIQLLMIWTRLEPHLPPLSSQQNENFWITFNFLWSARLVNGLKPHPPPLSNQKNEMLIFGSCPTPDDWPGWLMDSNPICHPSPAKKMKCSFLDYIQLLMIGHPSPAKKMKSSIGRVIQAKNVNRNVKKWKRPPKSSKNKMFIFGLRSTSDDWMSDPSKKCWPKCKKKPKKAP